MKVLLVEGGDSSERAVSLRSSKVVSAALRGVGHDVYHYDSVNGHADLRKAVKSVDVVLPMIHGRGGEDGSLQRVLEEEGVAFVGARSDASRVCYEKAQLKAILENTAIQTPRHELVTREVLNNLTEKLGYVLKPTNDGSSIDTYMLHSMDDILHVDHNVFDRHEVMLCEEIISGTEVTVGVLNDMALPVIEIIPPEGEEFDYANKYNGKTKELCPAVSLTARQQKQAQEVALEVHRLVGIHHLSRTDIIVTENNEYYVLETNTIPGMTNESLFPLAAKTAGISMEQLVDSLVTLAVSDS